MRIQHDTFPGVIWTVWHVPRCAEVPNVLWVDDGLHQWFELIRPARLDAAGQVCGRLHQARRIQVDLPAALILIDPADDGEGAVRRTAEDAPQELREAA